MIIAIDGPAASGKGTLGRLIAGHFGLDYLDTGSLYRAVARDVMARGIDIFDRQKIAQVAKELDPATLGDPALRDPGIGDAASIVAGFTEVRQALLAFQREFAGRDPGAVIDGRDIGTIVCPDADAKLFVTAKPQVRARRRFDELIRSGQNVTLAGVLDMIRRRDNRDVERAASPLRAAEDAYLLETSDLSIEAAFERAVAWIERKIGR